jgi:hypothetical protein
MVSGDEMNTPPPPPKTVEYILKGPESRKVSYMSDLLEQNGISISNLTYIRDVRRLLIKELVIDNRGHLVGRVLSWNREMTANAIYILRTDIMTQKILSKSEETERAIAESSERKIQKERAILELNDKIQSEKAEMGNQLGLKYKKCFTCEYYDYENQKEYEKANPAYCECMRVCIGDGDEYLRTSKIKKGLQTFDSLIMECQDTLSIETEIEKRFNGWMGNGKNRIHFKVENYKIPLLMVFLLIISIIFGRYAPNPFDLPPHSMERLISLFQWTGILLLGVPSAIVGVFSSFKIRISLKFNKSPKKQPTEADRFEFLRDAYIGTIQNLNNRLETIKDKIVDQIQAHTRDELEIKQFADILENTEEPLAKIKEAIKSLHESHKSVSEKQSEINEVLNEYIGENGYIAQKEKEIQRIKVAQELSDRMQKNFNTTLEIAKSVDVLTDAIIPGIKQLMSFKIPELIEDINFKCDRDKSYLQISS